MPVNEYGPADISNFVSAPLEDFSVGHAAFLFFSAVVGASHMDRVEDGYKAAVTSVLTSPQKNQRSGTKGLYKKRNT